MKKLLALLSTSPLLVTACGGSSTSATPELRIIVDNDNLASELQKSWDANENKGTSAKVSFIKEDLDQLPQKVVEQQGKQADIMLTISDQMIGRQAHFKPFTLDATITNELTNEQFTTVNAGVKNGKVYYPVLSNTLVGAINKDLAAKVGLDLTDADGDNRPDSIDTWEKIITIADKMATSYTGTGDNKYYGMKIDGTTAMPADVKLKQTYPVAANNAWAIYQLLSAKGFDMFPDASDPSNFGDLTKLGQGLELIKTLGASNVAGPLQSPPGWNFETPYKAGETLMTSIGTWMDLSDDVYNTDTTQFIKLPGDSKSLSGTKGWVVNGYTSYPADAEVLLKWLLTKGTMKTIVDNSSYLPIVKAGGALDPELNAKSAALKAASEYSPKWEPLHPLPENNKITALSGYYGISTDNITKQMWIAGSNIGDAGTAPVTTGAAAATKIKELYDAWYAENNKAA